MKRTCLLILVLCSPLTSLAAQTGIYQQGTVVRMRMAECMAPQRGFMAAISGNSVPQTDELCPEYTLVADKVVYIIAGKTSNQLIPLAESIDFRLKNSELLVRVDDARHETRFAVREMTLRSAWEHDRQYTQNETSVPTRRHSDHAIVMGASR